ncbi:MAG TPA: hypothetical protein VKB48_14070 [Candidatus Acidoferrum sp.]|nr:hypothetical protein [Candidatus Acidoferrum sp.]
MRSKRSPRNSPLRRRRKQTPAADLRVQLEIEHLKAILQDPLSTAQQKALALSQIAECQESAAVALALPADWLRQMDLLAE